MSGPDTTQYLSVADLIALHQAVMQRTGHRPAPLRDQGLLESALQRPSSAAYYEDADLIRQATLLAVGIAQARSFHDGNKRTAFAALDVFLRLNGVLFDGDPLELARQLEQLATRAGSLDDATDRFEQWLRDHTLI